MTDNYTHPTRSKAIRLKCLDCCAGQKSEVRKCEQVSCALWPFRMGPGKTQEPPEGVKYTRTLPYVPESSI